MHSISIDPQFRVHLECCYDFGGDDDEYEDDVG